MPIRILDAATVGRIAAGEVVERPSSVVKELIENSLDAGATSITVEIKGGGIDYLRVTDNGCGIEPGQVRLAFENHATSKLQRAEQLDDIRTLGFRGEALPSIAAVSRVEMTTRAREQETGMKLTVEGGQNMLVREAGCPQGTTIIMRDLFFNVPVRRAFLKKPAYEGGLVSDAVAKMLLGNPGVSMRFISGGNTLFHSFGDGKLRHAVFAVYGREAAEKMVELDASEGGTRIYGMIGVGELVKSTRSHQLFFINGRSVRCPLLSRALEKVCRSRVTIGMYPMCVLNLVVPHTGVDVNVHPNKLEVRFRDAEMMREACERLLEKAFEGERMLEIEKLTAEKPRVERRTEVREIPLAGADAPAAQAPVKEPETAVASKDEKPVPADQPAVMPELPVRTPGKSKAKPEETETRIINTAVKNQKIIVKPGDIPLENMHLPKINSANTRFVQHNTARNGGSMPPPMTMSVYTSRPAPGPIEVSMKRPVKPEQADVASGKLSNEVLKKAAQLPMDLPMRPAEKSRHNDLEYDYRYFGETEQGMTFRVVGVLFKTYILVEAEDTLLLIDQHAAHERLQYERLMKRVQEGTASQQLLTPLIVHLSAKEMAIIEENLDTLSEAGYTVEPFGQQEIRITAVPFVLGRAELKPIFLQMIQSLSQLKAATIDARRAQVMQMACKSAVKAGDPLSRSEIRALLEDMLSTGAPPTCPHGRPVVKTLTKRDLEKMFKRIQ